MDKPDEDSWFVYVLRCVDKSLYTGIAKDVNRRCEQHNAGTASRYTRGRLPVKLVYQEVQASRSLALKREAAIKALTRQEKESLLREKDSEGEFLLNDPLSASSERLVELLRETIETTITKAIAKSNLLSEPAPPPTPSPKSTGLELQATDKAKAADLRVALLMGKIPEDSGLLIDPITFAKLLNISR